MVARVLLNDNRGTFEFCKNVRFRDSVGSFDYLRAFLFFISVDCYSEHSIEIVITRIEIVGKLVIQSIFLLSMTNFGCEWTAPVHAIPQTSIAIGA